MKLFTPQEVDSESKKREGELRMKNHYLSEVMKKGIQKLNTLKSSYEPDKEKKLKEFETFCEVLNQKKSEMLKELKGIEQLIQDKKDTYFAMIEKEDEIADRYQKMQTDQKKLDDRERFIKESEAQLQIKWAEITNKKDA